MEANQLTSSMMNLARTPAEKKLLAHICQRAAINGGKCIDTNKELGQALSMHPQTVSNLVSRLADVLVKSASEESLPTGQRILIPSRELVMAYQAEINGSESPLSQDLPPLSQGLAPLSRDLPPPKPTVFTPAPVEDHPVPDQTRRCLITGLDISQQAEFETFANRQTLQLLQQTQPIIFEQLATQLLTPEEWTSLANDTDGCSLRMASRVRRLAKREVELAAYALKPVRVCPISGADITHQGVHYPFVTLETIMALFKVERASFTDMVVRLGLPDKSGKDRDTQCQQVLDRVLQLALTWVPQHPITYLGQVSTDQTGVHRYCPLTSIDITHQPEKHRFATALTIEALFKSNRSGFDEVATRLLPETYRQDEPAGQCLALSSRVKRLAQAYQ